MARFGRALLADAASRSPKRDELAEILLGCRADVNRARQPRRRRHVDVTGSAAASCQGRVRTCNFPGRGRGFADLPRLTLSNFAAPCGTFRASPLQRGSNDWNHFTLFELLGVKLGFG